MHENEIGKVVVNTAVPLHRDLGPGLVESVYEVVRMFERQGVEVERQVPVPSHYESPKFDEDSRADLIINGKVIVDTRTTKWHSRFKPLWLCERNIHPPIPAESLRLLLNSGIIIYN
jgi:GxxExxY protein